MSYHTQSLSLSADHKQLLDAVSQAIDSRLEPIRQENRQLKQQLDQMSQPAIPNAQSLVNRAPAQIKGQLPSEAERHGYQFRRACAFQRGMMEPENAKYELAVSQKLHDFYVQRGGLQLAGDRSTLVPLGTSLLDDQLGELRAELHQSLATSVHGADLGELRHIQQRTGSHYLRQALSWFDDTAMGVFAHGGPAGEMIELLRNREVFSRAGASQITLPPNGRLPYPKQTGSTTAYWVGENAAITDSEPSTGSINLVAKKLAGLTKLPNELVRFGNPSVEAFIRSDLARVLALEADLAMLEGIGSTTKVMGLLNYSGIVPYTASTTGSDGNTFEPQDVLKVMTELENRNHDTGGMTWCMRFAMWANLLNRRSGSGYADDDGNGAWLFQANRNNIGQAMPSMLSGSPVVTSNQISNTRVKGNGADLTYILAGIFSEFLIGRVGVMELATSTSGDTAFVTDQTWLRAIQHIDAAPRHENAFVLIDDLDMDLPAA